MRSDSGGRRPEAPAARPAPPEPRPAPPAPLPVPEAPAAPERLPPEKALGAILRRARERRGLEIEQVAQAAAVGLSPLLGWEAGITLPRLDSLTRLGGVVGLDLGDLAAAVPPAAPDQRRYHRFGEVFAAARQRRKLSVAAVARSVGVAETTVLTWEEGKSLPQNRWLPRLARRLGLHLGEVDALLGGPAAPEEPEEELVAPGGEAPRSRRTTARLGAMLRARREERGWSRSRLAERAGIPAGNIGTYEAGASAPGLEYLGRLAWALDLGLGDFEALASPWAEARRRWGLLGLALRLRREQRGWTREELAVRAELGVVLVRRWEEDPEAVSLRTLDPLAGALGLGLGELDELLGQEAPRTVRFEEIGRALGTVRDRRGIEREELARWTGISIKQIGAWEAGRVPNVAHFGLAAAAIELDLGELDAALDDAAARARADHDAGVDANARRLARELLGDPPARLETERQVAVLLAAARAVAAGGR